MKKAFTLLEVVIAITIFLIIVFFMYKVLDDTKISNNKFHEQVVKSENLNELYKIISEDIAESRGIITLSENRDKNSILIFESNNTYNNPYFTNITYMLSLENNLIRIESKEKFEKEKIDEEFFLNSYIDILVKDVEKFKIIKKDDKYVFFIKPKNGKEIVFPTFKMGEF